MCRLSSCDWMWPGAAHYGFMCKLWHQIKFCYFLFCIAVRHRYILYLTWRCSAQLRFERLSWVHTKSKMNLLSFKMPMLYEMMVGKRKTLKIFSMEKQYWFDWIDIVFAHQREQIKRIWVYFPAQTQPNTQKSHYDLYGHLSTCNSISQYNFLNI